MVEVCSLASKGVFWRACIALFALLKCDYASTGAVNEHKTMELTKPISRQSAIATPFNALLLLRTAVGKHNCGF